MVHSALEVRHFSTPRVPFSDLCSRFTGLATFLPTFHAVLTVFLAGFVAALGSGPVWPGCQPISPT